MKKTLLNIFFISSILFSTSLLTACSKNDDNTSVAASTNKDYFMNNAIDHDLTVLLAIDNTADITSKFNGYTVRLTQVAALSGTASVKNDLLTVNGTWSVDANYDKISFVFPTTTIPDLTFVNKEWQFASRSSTTIDLVSTNGENDKLQLSRK